MKSPAVATLEADTLLQLHMPRSLAELREAMGDLLERLLPAASFAVLVEDQNDGQLAVELARGPACPLAADARIVANTWEPDGVQRRRLLYRGLPIGEMLVLHQQPLDELPWFSTLLSHYAAALANLKLDTAALSMVDHYCAGLQAFEEGVVLFQEKERDATAARFLQLVASLLRANHGALLTYARIGDATSELRTDQLLGVPEDLVSVLRAGDDWAASRVEHGTALYDRSASSDFPRLPPDGPAAAVHNIVTCPLRYHGITAGVALIFNAADFDREMEAKLVTLRGLGELGAALLHRIQLEHEAVFAKQLETQLAIAALVQARLLPSQPPGNSKWTYAWRSRPSQSIGGDYLDLFDAPDQSVCAVVADVSGHGINSALLMTSARAHFRALAGRMTPAQALARLNEEVHREVGSTGMFVTGAALRLADDGCSLVFASAGHNPLFVVRPTTRSVEHLESSGPPLGFMPQAEYSNRRLTLSPGDVVVLYTDGITEALDARQEEMFGEDRLAATILQVVERDVDAILAHILQAVERFAGRTSYDDDASLVVLKVAARG